MRRGAAGSRSQEEITLLSHSSTEEEEDEDEERTVRDVDEDAGKPRKRRKQVRDVMMTLHESMHRSQ